MSYRLKYQHSTQVDMHSYIDFKLIKNTKIRADVTNITKYRTVAI